MGALERRFKWMVRWESKKEIENHVGWFPFLPKIAKQGHEEGVVHG